ncbi:MAG: hypothetical protein IPM08_08395 [Actinomycetales bacterium]|nr:hypothetical protein [Actinomycetales bacterium]
MVPRWVSQIDHIQSNPPSSRSAAAMSRAPGRTATANAAAVGPLAKTTAAIAAVVPAARVTMIQPSR